MLKLDRNDPLDRMILRELGGNPVLFDEWLDAMDELEDEPDCGQILREKGLDREAVLREARAYRGDFHARLSERGMPVYDRFTLCRRLHEQAQAAPALELLRLFCEVLCGPGFLLDHESEITGEDDRVDAEEQIILQYLNFVEERDGLLQVLLRHGELAKKFSEITKENRSPTPVDCDTERKHEILQCFTALFDIPAKAAATFCCTI